MKILVLNGGSSSFKSSLFEVEGLDGGDAAPPHPLWEARVDWEHHPGSAEIQVKADGATSKRTVPVKAPLDSLDPLMEMLPHRDRDPRGRTSRGAWRPRLSRQHPHHARSARRHRRNGQLRARAQPPRAGSHRVHGAYPGPASRPGGRVRYRIPCQPAAACLRLSRDLTPGSARASAATDFTASAINTPRAVRPRFSAAIWHRCA